MFRRLPVLEQKYKSYKKLVHNNYFEEFNTFPNNY